jgi:hypothetical protein|tara:strand:+ start:485 stop:1165 length:681 start_codon:yes stop_codon:yes gene_type:complete
MEMQGLESPKYLNHKLRTEISLFLRYFHSYKRAYHDLQWEIDEASLLLKIGLNGTYNIWKFNETLYKYAESSISCLYWLYGDEKMEYPFVHQFLREWRNEYHHNAKNDFVVYDFSFNVEDKRYSFKDNFYVFPITLFSDRLKKLMNKWFKSEKIVTNASVNGLVEYHHAFMLDSMSKFQEEMNKKMPEKYLINTQSLSRLLGGGSYTRLITENDFWEQKKSTKGSN